MAKPMSKKIVRAMVEGRLFKTTGRFLWLHIKRIANKLNPENWLMNLSRLWICWRTPVEKNKIFLHSFQGDYTCNPKYITEELLRRNADVQIVWALRKASIMDGCAVPPQVKTVEQYSYEYFEELASSRIWVDNSVDFLKKKIHKKKNQVLIETWHGSLGIKRFTRDVNAGKAWVRAAEKCGRIADYCISNSQFENNVYRESFWPNTPIIQYGHPRNDILMQKNHEQLKAIRASIFAMYDIPSENHLVLYAPTFRDDHRFEYYNINVDGLLHVLHERFGGHWTLLTRYHPTVRKMAKNRKQRDNRNAIDVTNYPDIQELMAVADVAITDYSSWIYDFVLTRRPGFIFATDVKDYYSERGFYYPLESTPFPIAENNGELFHNIRCFNAEKYEEDVCRFLDERGCIEDGNASSRVVDKMLEILSAELVSTT